MPTKRQRRKRRRRLAGADGAGLEAPTASEGDGSGQQMPPAVAADEARRPSAARLLARGPERPQALSGSFPLSELVVLIGLVLLVVGFFTTGQQGGVLMFVGGGLAALAGLELAVREHFAGYKS